MKILKALLYFQTELKAYGFKVEFTITVFEDLKNPYGIGIEKAKGIKNKKYHIEDLIDGKHVHYPIHKFKNKLFSIKCRKEMPYCQLS